MEHNQEWSCRWRQSFFGLAVDTANEFKINVYKECFYLAYYSQGAVNIDIAYTLPIHLRKFYIKLIAEINEKQKEEAEKQNIKKNPSKVDKPF